MQKMKKKKKITKPFNIVVEFDSIYCSKKQIFIMRFIESKNEGKRKK